MKDPGRCREVAVSGGLTVHVVLLVFIILIKPIYTGHFWCNICRNFHCDLCAISNRTCRPAAISVRFGRDFSVKSPEVSNLWQKRHHHCLWGMCICTDTKPLLKIIMFHRNSSHIVLKSHWKCSQLQRERDKKRSENCDKNCIKNRLCKTGLYSTVLL